MILINMIKMIFFFSLFITHNNWEKYYEDKDILISYTSQVCDDKANAFTFEYFLIKVENKTNETLVVNFQKSNEQINRLEDKVAFVLNPNQIIEGTCEYNTNQLRIFKSENTIKDSDFNYEFELSKIEVIEVY